MTEALKSPTSPAAVVSGPTTPTRAGNQPATRPGPETGHLREHWCPQCAPSLPIWLPSWAVMGRGMGDNTGLAQALIDGLIDDTEETGRA